MRLKKAAAAAAAALMIGGVPAANAQFPDSGSLGSSTSQLPQQTETVTTPSGLTANYRVENCNGSYFIAGTMKTTQRGYMWLRYEGPMRSDEPGKVTYGTMPLWTGFLEPGYETDEIPLGAAGSVVNNQPAYLTFGFDPFGPNGIINLPDAERAVSVVIDPATAEKCS